MVQEAKHYIPVIIQDAGFYFLSSSRVRGSMSRVKSHYRWIPTGFVKIFATSLHVDIYQIDLPQRRRAYSGKINISYLCGEL